MMDNTENTGGEDYTFVHGIPVVPVGEGKVVYSAHTANSGKVLMIGYGLFDIVYGHLDELFVEVGGHVDRMTVVGTEGSTGRGGANLSHVHVSILGNAALVGDPVIDANYDLRDRDNPFSSSNYPVDPKNVCAARGKPLFERPYNPESDRQFDTQYIKTVINLVKHSYAALKNNLYKFGDIPHPKTGDLLTKAISEGYLLTTIINFSVYRFEVLTGYAYRDMPALQLSRLRQRRKMILGITDQTKGTDDFPNLVHNTQISVTLDNGRVLNPRMLVEADWLAEIFENISNASRHIMLTSPYIDHTNPETIRAVAEANPPEIQSLIYDRDYYGQFLPPDVVSEGAIEATGQPLANEVRRTP